MSRTAIPGAKTIRWISTFVANTGFGREARELSRAVPEDWDLRIVDHSPPSLSFIPSPADLAFFRSHLHSGPLRSYPFVQVIHLPIQNIPAIVLPSSHQVGRLMFEAWPVPDLLLKLASEVERIWIPSTFVRRLFEEERIADGKLTIIPAGVHIPKTRKEPRVHENETWTFLSVFDWTSRKDPVSLVRGFGKVFMNNSRVKLIIKTGNISSHQFARFISSLFPNWSLWPDQIKVINSVLSEEQMDELYASADVFVLPSHCEGFGLPYLEAMARGIPVIAPDKGGHLDFCTPKNAILVPCSESTIVNGDSAFRGRHWFSIDEDAFCDTLSHVVHHQECVEKRRDISRESARHWSWDHARELVTRELIALS